MNKPSIFALFLFALVPACGVDAADGDGSSRTVDALRQAKARDASGPALPSVCIHASEASCLADEGCAWGDQGSGPECFFVGEVLPQPTTEPTLPPAAPPATPTLPSPTPGDPPMPSVCSHHASEASCLADEGCAWGDQGSGSECFYVGEIVPFGK